MNILLKIALLLLLPMQLAQADQELFKSQKIDVSWIDKVIVTQREVIKTLEPDQGIIDFMPIGINKINDMYCSAFNFKIPQLKDADLLITFTHEQDAGLVSWGITGGPWRSRVFFKHQIVVAVQDNEGKSFTQHLDGASRDDIDAGGNYSMWFCWKAKDFNHEKTKISNLRMIYGDFTTVVGGEVVDGEDDTDEYDVDEEHIISMPKLIEAYQERLVGK